MAIILQEISTNLFLSKSMRLIFILCELEDFSRIDIKKLFVKITYSPYRSKLFSD